MRVVSSTFVVAVAAFAATLARAQPAPPIAGFTSNPATSQQALSALISRLLADAIPLEYDKQKDWGAVADIPVGVRLKGKGFHAKLRKRTRTVNHGVWKHYKLRLIEPKQNLVIELVDLWPTAPNSVAFTLRVGAKVDAWARAKVYQYGVHVIALEMEGDLHMHLTVAGELAIVMNGIEDGFSLVLVPQVASANVTIDEFNLRRVSNAHGPVVRELGDGVRGIVEDELNGPRLMEKLNRSIDKKRDRLTFRPAQLLHSEWWPIQTSPAAGLPAAPAPAP